MPRPLEGVRILAIEQMQALPYATQLLARLGADVVKVEPITGESGRGSQPSMIDPEGRSVGATFLRNNLDKRSIGIDLKAPEGRELFLALVPQFDVIAENFKPGTMDRLGLGYDVIAERAPKAIYLSISGFGQPVDGAPSPYDSWPAYAAIAESMSGIYEYKREDEPSHGSVVHRWRQSRPPFAPGSRPAAVRAGHQLRRERPLTQEWAEAGITLACEQGFPVWLGQGAVLQGWARADQGHLTTQHIEQLRQLIQAGTA